MDGERLGPLAETSWLSSQERSLGLHIARMPVGKVGIVKSSAI